MGRPPKPENEKCNIYNSMRALSRDKNIPYEALKAAKLAGCPGFFPNGRLDWRKIEPWLQEKGNELEIPEDGDNITQWRMRLVRAQAQKAELDLEKSKEHYVPKEEVAEMLNGLAIAQKNLLKTRLVQELPPQLYGLSVEQMIDRMEQEVTEICKMMQTIKV